MESPVFEGPDGELTLNPSLEMMRTLLNTESDYWDGGSGSAYLGWVELRDPGYRNIWERPSLHLIVHDPYGINISYQIMNYQPHTSNVKLMVYREDVLGDFLVEHYLGGEPAYFPGRSFVTRDVAVQVIHDFLQTEKPSSSVVWRPQIQSEYSGFGYGKLD